VKQLTIHQIPEVSGGGCYLPFHLLSNGAHDYTISAKHRAQEGACFGAILGAASWLSGSAGDSAPVSILVGSAIGAVGSALFGLLEVHAWHSQWPGKNGSMPKS